MLMLRAHGPLGSAIRSVVMRSRVFSVQATSGGWRHYGQKASTFVVPFAAVVAGSTSLCAESAQEEQKQAIEEEQKQGDAFIDSLAPLAQQLTLGTVMGYSSGYALRVAGRVAAFSVGCLFMVVQGAAYMGYIDVNWKNIAADSRKFIDVNGDGELDGDDAKIIMNKFIEVCTFNLPSGAGFSGGLALGLGFGGATAGKAAAAISAASVIPRVFMAGTAVTAGGGVMVAAKDQYDRARAATTSVLRNMTSGSASKMPEGQIFSLALKGMDIVALREVEKQLKGKIKDLSSEADKSKFKDQLAEVEATKKEVKRRA